MDNSFRPPPHGASRWRLAVLAAALALAACAPRVARPPEALGVPDGFPEAEYRQIAAQGGAVFRIEPSRSLIVIEVRRAGSLARVGHDHVVAAHDVRGYVAPDESRADLYLKLEDLVVDEPDLRAEAKLDTHPSPEDIAGTRRNMLNAFQAETFPFALVRIQRSDPEADAPVDVAVTLHGMTRTVKLPVRIVRTGDELSATGALALRQTDFDVKPLSILGGALQVGDEVGVSFAIRARRVR
jgi:YceI-like protein